MLLTNNIVKFNKLLVKIPKQTKRVWDLAEIDGVTNPLRISNKPYVLTKWWERSHHLIIFFYLSKNIN